MAVASLVLGILAVLFMLVPVVNVAAVIMAVAGLVFGVMAKKRLDYEDKPTGMATAGVILAVIALVASVSVLVACFACAATCQSVFDSCVINAPPVGRVE